MVQFSFAPTARHTSISSMLDSHKGEQPSALSFTFPTNDQGKFQVYKSGQNAYVAGVATATFRDAKEQANLLYTFSAKAFKKPKTDSCASSVIGYAHALSEAVDEKNIPRTQKLAREESVRVTGDRKKVVVSTPGERYEMERETVRQGAKNFVKVKVTEEQVKAMLAAQAQIARLNKIQNLAPPAPLPTPDIPSLTEKDPAVQDTRSAPVAASSWNKTAWIVGAVAVGILVTAAVALT